MHFQSTFLIICLSSATFLISFLCCESELVLVHLLFRHGERTVYRFYPTDPYINETFYPFGVEGLTNNGKLMMYHVGEMLRKKYGKFLGDYYTEDVIEARSTGTSRTIMTAQLILSGLWPPVLKQKWHPTLNWLPIPVLSKPLAEEDLLEAEYCKRRNFLLKELIKNPVIHNTYLKPHQEIIEYVEKHSGIQVKDMWDLFQFFWTLKAEIEYGLKLPDWTNTIYPEPLRSSVLRCLESRNIGVELKRFHAGYLIQKWLNDSIAKANNNLQPAGRKMFLYAAHDSTVGYLLNGLNVTEPHIPEYGCGVVFELHRIDGKYFLKLRYLRSAASSNFEDLTIPGCQTICPLDKFTSLVSDLLPTINYQKACLVK